MQHGFPLDESRGWHADLSAFLQIHFLPGAPITVRIFYVAATGKNLYIAGPAEFRPPPAREDTGIKHIALVAAFVILRSQQKYFSQITGCGEDSTIGGLGECRDLGGARFNQIGVFVFPSDFENVSAVPGAGQKMTLGIEREGIDEVLMRSPETAGRAIRRDPVNFRTSGCAHSQGKESARACRTARGVGNGDSGLLSRDRPWVLTRQSDRWKGHRRRVRMFLSRSCRINVAGLVDRQGGDFFL